MSKIITVRKFGNSLVFRVPKTICQMLNIERDTKYEVSIFGDVLQFKRAKDGE